MGMQGEDSHVIMEAETGVLQLQANNTRAASNTQKLREHGLFQHLDSRFLISRTMQE